MTSPPHTPRTRSPSPDFLTSLLFPPSPTSRTASDGLQYGPVAVRSAPRSGAAQTKLANMVFNAGLVAAELIERGGWELGGERVLELGAGTGLPSLLASALTDTPKSILITDYPDETILDTLKLNVSRNASVARLPVKVEGLEWGTDASKLLEAHGPFTTLITSDLLWYLDGHSALLSSLLALLHRSPSARILLTAGDYTPVQGIDSFFASAAQAGLEYRVVQLEDEWLGEMGVVFTGEREQDVAEQEAGLTQDMRDLLSIRKRKVWAWELRWGENVVGRREVIGEGWKGA